MAPTCMALALKVIQDNGVLNTLYNFESVPVSGGFDVETGIPWPAILLTSNTDTNAYLGSPPIGSGIVSGNPVGMKSSQLGQLWFGPKTLQIQTPFGTPDVAGSDTFDLNNLFSSGANPPRSNPIPYAQESFAFPLQGYNFQLTPSYNSGAQTVIFGMSVSNERGNLFGDGGAPAKYYPSFDMSVSIDANNFGFLGGSTDTSYVSCGQFNVIGSALNVPIIGKGSVGTVALAIASHW